VLKPAGTIWGTYPSIYATGFALQLAGYKILNDIGWYKPNASPNLSCRYFTASHETVIRARKDAAAKHTFNYGAMRDGDWHLTDRLKNRGTQMRSVWAIGRPTSDEKKFGKHPTQKPEALLNRIILASTRPGDLLLDPFTGSSTTGIVARDLGRRFVGIDNKKSYLKLSVFHEKFGAPYPSWSPDVKRIMGVTLDRATELLDLNIWRTRGDWNMLIRFTP
jgi:site-specific DNA-methyltransferase (adenine-specific)